MPSAPLCLLTSTLLLACCRLVVRAAPLQPAETEFQPVELRYVGRLPAQDLQDSVSLLADLPADLSDSSRYGDWVDADQPRLYLLTELAETRQPDYRRKREASPGYFRTRSSASARASGQNLSIVNPIEVLRQRVMLEIYRRKMHENSSKLTQNSRLLNDIGKRNIVRRSQTLQRHGIKDRSEVSGR